MTVYTDREAQDQLLLLLDKAASEGEVRIKRADGKEFVVRPAAKSALDVGFVDVEISADEIVDAVREMRERPIE